MALFPAPSSEERIRKIERIKEYFHHTELEILDKKTKTWRLKDDKELEPLIQKEMKKRWDEFSASATFHIEIVNKNIPERSGRYATNIAVFPEAYGSKGQGKLSLDGLVDDIIRQLKFKPKEIEGS